MVIVKKKGSIRSLGVDLQLHFGPFPIAASVQEDARIFSRVTRCLFMRKNTFFSSTPHKSHTHADDSMISKFSTGTKYIPAHDL